MTTRNPFILDSAADKTGLSSPHMNLHTHRDVSHCTPNVSLVCHSKQCEQLALYPRPGLSITGRCFQSKFACLQMHLPGRPSLLQLLPQQWL